MSKSSLRIVLSSLALIAAGNLATAQDSPYEKIPTRVGQPMLISDGDEEGRALLKECYNVTYAEIQIRYNYWLQGIGDVDDLLDNLIRFQEYRIELEGEMDKLKFAEQLLAFVKELEEQCKRGKSKIQFESDRTTQEARIRSFLSATKLEVARLREGPERD